VGALAAGFWGFVGGASLLLGALVGASRRLIATVMALGAGVLISSVAFELMEEAYNMGGFDSSSLGLLLGAVAFFFADREVNRRGASQEPWKQAGRLGDRHRERRAYGRDPRVGGHRHQPPRRRQH
jgi:ZIP family zinc transporter